MVLLVNPGAHFWVTLGWWNLCSYIFLVLLIFRCCIFQRLICCSSRFRFCCLSRLKPHLPCSFLAAAAFLSFSLCLEAGLLCLLLLLLPGTVYFSLGSFSLFLALFAASAAALSAAAFAKLCKEFMVGGFSL